MQALSEGYSFDNYAPSSVLETGLFYGGKTARVITSSVISVLDISLQVIHILAITIISALDHIESAIFGYTATYSANLQWLYFVIIIARVFTKEHLQFIEERTFNTNLSTISDKYFDFWTQ